MYSVNGFLVIRRIEDTVGKIWSDMLDASSIERLPYDPRTFRGSHDGVRRMVGAQRRGQILRRNHLEMIGYWPDLTFTVEMVDGREFNVARSNAQGFILDGLKKLDSGRGSVWKPDWCSVFESRMNIRFVQMKQGLLGAAPRRPRQRSHNVQLSAAFGRNRLDMR